MPEQERAHAVVALARRFAELLNDDDFRAEPMNLFATTKGSDST